MLYNSIVGWALQTLGVALGVRGGGPMFPSSAILFLQRRGRVNRMEPNLISEGQNGLPFNYLQDFPVNEVAYPCREGSICYRDFSQDANCVNTWTIECNQLKMYCLEQKSNTINFLYMLYQEDC